MSKYTVGQIAKALGVSSQTLRHYESLGLITSTRNDDNQYRTYSLDDTRLLFMVSIYRSMGFSLPKIKEMIKEMNEKQIMNSFDDRVMEVEKEIHQLQLIKRELIEYREGIERSFDHAENYWIEENGPEMVSVMKSGNGLSLENEHDNQLVEYQKLAPHVRQGFVISRDSLIEEKNFEFKYGVFVSSRYAKEYLSEHELQKYWVSIEGPVAKTVIKTNGETFSKEIFENFLHWIDSQGYEIVSDLYGVARYHAYYHQETTLFEFAVSIRMRFNSQTS